MTAKRPFRWRVGDPLDEWLHRHQGLSWPLCKYRWPYDLIGRLCDRRELSYGVPAAVIWPLVNTPTTVNSTVDNVTWTHRHHWHDWHG